MNSKTARATCCCGGKTACDCPTCTGLECLERPRFFTGQLLTADELNDQQAYVRAKNRLHNLHLHGWGVVCGLEVVCHECEGWVTVSTGYAIDPCGEDVIVCKEHPLDVAGMIRECKEARRRRRRSDCEPIRRPKDPDDSKEGREEHWCITLSYDEREGRPTTALRREACDTCGCGPGCKCSCPCHEGGEEKGCGCDGKERRTSSTRRGMGKTVSPCEPTRIFETYRLDVCEAPEDYCVGYQSEAEKAWRGKLDECFDGLRQRFAKMPRQSIGTLVDVQLDGVGVQSGVGTSANQSARGLYDAYVRTYDAVREQVRRNPGSAHCSALERLDALGLPREPGPEESASVYAQEIRPQARQLLSILVLYLIDCVCWALLPPCAPCCPGEDELILACVTVRDGRIEHICNYSCRRWGGALPPTLGGIHLGPIWPLIARLLGTLCCGDLVDRLLDFARGSEQGRRTVQLFASESFARPRLLFDRLRNFSFTDLFAGAQEEKINAAAWVDRPVKDLQTEAKAQGVELTVEEVEEAPFAVAAAALPPVGRGDRLVVYAREGDVVGFARPGSAEAELVHQGRELAALRKQVDELLKRGGGENASNLYDGE